MSKLTTTPLALHQGERTAALPACRFFEWLSVLAVDGTASVITGAHESCAILLSGTFDLVGGGTTWPARGARSTPESGRPVAVFLPKQTNFVAANGQGEILRIGARQPQAPVITGREALRMSPLLQMAGSGKAFDPTTGEWQPAETFPTAPESLPPRRIERVSIGACTVERVFAADYKAATLTVDEVQLPTGATFAPRELPLPNATECLLYIRAIGQLLIEAGDQQTTVTGEQAVLWSGAPSALKLSAIGGNAYVVFAYAGK
ncbi:hypothetical protein LBMAG49_04900 [Planctomycetota bacterium]|nr:hypothetical protein LBMAG49_04900 [Planctomycetota bacterium]